MKNKSAIITGSTSGIGLSLAQHLAKEGCHIMLNGFGERHEIENLQQELSEQNQVRVLYSDADMTVPEQIVEMVQSAAEAFGGVDILVNNAGIQHVAPIDEFPIEKWDLISFFCLILSCIIFY